MPPLEAPEAICPSESTQITPTVSNIASSSSVLSDWDWVPLSFTSKRPCSTDETKITEIRNQKFIVEIQKHIAEIRKYLRNTASKPSNIKRESLTNEKLAKQIRKYYEVKDDKNIWYSKVSTMKATSSFGIIKHFSESFPLISRPFSHQPLHHEMHNKIRHHISEARVNFWQKD